MMPRNIVKDRELALLLGLLCWGAGAFLLHDAFEGRGRSRPFALRLGQALA